MMMKSSWIHQLLLQEPIIVCRRSGVFFLLIGDGLFSNINYEVGDHIADYNGEVISHEEAERRERNEEANRRSEAARLDEVAEGLHRERRERKEEAERRIEAPKRAESAGHVSVSSHRVSETPGMGEHRGREASTGARRDRDKQRKRDAEAKEPSIGDGIVMFRKASAGTRMKFVQSQVN